jgi:replicative DNA helicase
MSKDLKNLTPPHSPDAEKAVLGSIIKNSECLTLVESLLDAPHFFLDAHRKIYAAITDLSAHNESVDILTVADRLRGKEGDTDTIGPAYLVELTESSPVTQNVEYYAKIVRTDFYRRQIISACQETIHSALALDGSIESYIERVEKEFLSIAKNHDRKGIVPAREALDSTLEEIETRLARGEAVTGVPTGYTELDKLLGGFQPSDLIILAARPGMGKTAFALNCAANAAKAGKNVVIFTLEMTKEQLMGRVLSSEAKVDSSRLSRGDLTEDEEDRLAQGARLVYTLSATMGIDETPGVTLMELRSRCRRYQKEFGLDMVIIDYLQLMGASSAGKRYESREREISEISMGLKSLAKELKIPIIALAQLNRGPDARPDKRPKMSDLRESGSMEQDADLIAFIYRDEYYNPGSEDTGVAEINIAKNRHGSTASIKLAFLPNFVSFQNLFKEGGQSHAHN